MILPPSDILPPANPPRIVGEHATRSDRVKAAIHEARAAIIEAMPNVAHAHSGDCRSGYERREEGSVSDEVKAADPIIGMTATCLQPYVAVAGCGCFRGFVSASRASGWDEAQQIATWIREGLSVERISRKGIERLPMDCEVCRVD